MFPKAKLQRFNDVKSCTPSPADYNTVKNDVDGGYSISKSARFSHSADRTLPEDWSLLSCNSSFQTPNTSKRKSDSSSECSNEKKRLITECSNKDLLINNLTEEIDEIKQENVRLATENKTLNNELIRWNKEAIKYENDKCTWNTALFETNIKLRLIKEKQEEDRKKNQEDLKEFHANIDDLDKLYKQTVNMYNKDVSIKNKINEDLKNEVTLLLSNIEDLKGSHREHIYQSSKQHDLLMQEKEKLLADLSETESKLKESKRKLETENNYKQKFNSISIELEIASKTLNQYQAKQENILKKFAAQMNNFSNNISHQIEKHRQKANEDINHLLAKLDRQEATIRPTLKESLNDYLVNQKIKELQETVSKLKEQLERSELNCKLLAKHKSDAEKETREITTKYADLLGHQNHKQKVKHLTDLKRNYFEVVEQNKQMDAQLNQQYFSIAQYKKEIEDLQKKLGKVPHMCAE